MLASFGGLFSLFLLPLLLLLLLLRSLLLLLLPRRLFPRESRSRLLRMGERRGLGRKELEGNQKEEVKRGKEEGRKSLREGLATWESCPPAAAWAPSGRPGPPGS